MRIFVSHWWGWCCSLGLVTDTQKSSVSRCLCSLNETRQERQHISHNGHVCSFFTQLRKQAAGKRGGTEVEDKWKVICSACGRFLDTFKFSTFILILKWIEFNSVSHQTTQSTPHMTKQKQVFGVFCKCFLKKDLNIPFTYCKYFVLCTWLKQWQPQVFLEMTLLVEVSPILLGRKRVGQKVLVCSHFLPRCSQPCCRKISPQHVSTTFFWL